MIRKFPLGETIENIFEFSFQRYGTILRIVWLPLLLVMAIFLLLMIPAMSVVIAAASQAPHSWAARAEYIACIVLGELVVLYCFVWMRVGLTKEILGLHEPRRFLYLPGMDELRTIVAYVLVFLLVYVILLAAVLAVVVCGAVLGLGFIGQPDSDLSPAWLLLAIPLGVVCYIAIVYLMIRMTWLIVPVTVAHKRIDVFGSWRLMRGNVLRGFVTMIVAMLPLLGLELVFVMLTVIPGPSAQTPPASYNDFVEFTLHDPTFWIGVAVVLAAVPVVAGLFSAPSAFAYKALTAPVPESATQPTP